MTELAHSTPARRPVANGLVLLLRVVQALLALGLAGMAAAAVLALVPGSLIQQAVADPAGTVDVSAGSFAFAMAAAAVTAAAWIYVLQLLIRIIRTVQAGNPFDDANIGRLRAMWVIITAAELFRMAIYGMANISVLGANVSEADTGLDIRIGTWFLVLVIAALSEAFRHGAAMRREQELTI